MNKATHKISICKFCRTFLSLIQSVILMTLLYVVTIILYYVSYVTYLSSN